MSVETKLTEAIADLMPHQRHGTPLNRAAALTRIAGMEEAQAVDYIFSNAPGERRPELSEIREAYRFAANGSPGRGIQGIPLGGNKYRWHRSSIPMSKSLSRAELQERLRLQLSTDIRNFVQTLVEMGKGFTSKDIIAMSPTRIPTDPALQAAAQLFALGCDTGFPIWAGNISKNFFGNMSASPFEGNGIIHPDILAMRLTCSHTSPNHISRIPLHISLNPRSGMQKQTAKGHLSFDCLATVASFRYVLIEFDHLPLPTQAEIVAGMIRHPSLSVVTATYSGGKSIHTVLRLPDCPDITSYQRHGEVLMSYFASADDPCFRADCNPIKNPATHIRLAGAIRPETNHRQHLIFCNRYKHQTP